MLSPAELPVNPRVLGRLLRVLGNRRAPAGEIAGLVRCDPVLTLQLLTTGARDGSGHEEAFSLQGYVDWVGASALDALALRQAVRALGQRPDVTPRSPLSEVWRRSLLCGLTAEALAERAGQPVEEAYVAGLLHSVGKLAALCAPDEYAAMLVSARSEQPPRGADGMPHEVLGAELVASCARPAFLADAVRLQRERTELLTDAPFIVRVVAVASRLVDEGATAPLCSDGALLLGLHERAVARALDDAMEAAQRNPGGVDLSRGVLPAWPESGEPPAAGAPGGSESSTWGPVTQAVGESGLRAAVRHAMSSVQGQTAALRRARHLASLLMGFERQMVFLASAEDRTLRAVPLEGDQAKARELVIPLASSRSMLATAARERRPVHAFGAALERGAAAVDRVLARMLGSQGLLCLPLSSGNGVSGVVAFGLDAAWDEQRAMEDGTLSVLTASAADAVALAAHRSREEERTRNELTAQFRAMGKRVVHEAGNPLSIVKNYLQVLANKAGGGGPFRDELAIINEELDRIARIVQRMGEPFAAEGESAGPLDLNALVREVVTLCNETLFAGRGIEVQQQLDPALPLLRSDPGTVKQVVLNLMTNAAEAMSEGGRLMLLTADNVNLDGELFVLLQVTDTGPGVAPDVLQRLFQPGVTSKGDGHEGIGLAVSESIMRRLGGRILCRSSPGRGTIFGVLLPRRSANDTAGPAR